MDSIFTEDTMMRQKVFFIPIVALALMMAGAAMAAEMLGGCKSCIDITADYAKQREQYGKPIGGFQVIQHYMANMLTEYDTSQNYLYRTACMIDEGEDFAMDASALKAPVRPLESGSFASMV